MKGRFAPAIVAFGIATATVTHATLRPDFLLQLADPNLLGSAAYSLLLQHFGYAFVLGVCAALGAAAVMLVAWRTRTRGATDWHAALAAALAALCLLGQLGVGLNPIGWVCAAALCLLLDRDDNASVSNAIGVAAVWSLLQGGSTLGAVLALLALVGAVIDARCFDARVRRKAIAAAGICIVGLLQVHGAPWHAYGAHALYIDALTAGAQRETIWAGGIGLAGIAFALILTIAGWYGIRRRDRSGDALSFFALLLLALVDARNLPYFGIVAAPIVADAVASYYVSVRTMPVSSVRAHLVTFAAAAFGFIAVLTLSEPKAVHWPAAPGEPSKLFAQLAGDSRNHRVLCMQPSWCDGTSAILPRIHPVLDDAGGSADLHRLQSDVVTVSGHWREELASAHVDAVVADAGDAVVSLLTAAGWHAAAYQDTRVLLERGTVQ